MKIIHGKTLGKGIEQGAVEFLVPFFGQYLTLSQFSTLGPLSRQPGLYVQHMTITFLPSGSIDLFALLNPEVFFNDRVELVIEGYIGVGHIFIHF